MSVMPAGLRYERPASLRAASDLLSRDGAVALAGGQSLLAAMKLGLNESQMLVDLQDIASLRGVSLQADRLTVGAMSTHTEMARSDVMHHFAPGLCALAHGIADQQVRNMGTLGGSLANNDPAACWPAALLAANATVITMQRRIAAGDFFQGLYTTALQPGEIITAVEFPQLAQFTYIKFEQKASRFALVGVAIACFADSAPRVAITGLGAGVALWNEAGEALNAKFSVHSLDCLDYPEHQARSDLHASGAYRAHLVKVLTRRCVAAVSKENPGLTLIKPAQNAIKSGAIDSTRSPASAPAPDGLQMQGEQTLNAHVAVVWQRLLEPATLKACIAGCESFEQISPSTYAAQVKIGLGPVSARFKVDVQLQDMEAPKSCTLVFRGNAGALGSGEGRALVRLEPEGEATQLHWQAHSQVTGRLAQLGSRLIAASADKLTQDFFNKFAQQFAQTRSVEKRAGLWQSFIQIFQRLFRS
jgi:CO/xanthine dehydrogenase FAD-binding subunit/carbon monoxide dehydrogenase subunit G